MTIEENNNNIFAFDEGIRAGGIRSKSEIKTLICYMLKSVDVPVTKKTVIDALQKDSLANYFESSSSFDELVKMNNIEETESGYILTENGKLIANQLENTLPLTVREKAFYCMINFLSEEKKKKENKVEIIKNQNGYFVKCSISGGEIELLEFSLYVPDYNDAKIVKKSFMKNPTLVYKTLLSVLSKDKDVIKDTLQDIEKLN